MTIKVIQKQKAKGIAPVQKKKPNSSLQYIPHAGKFAPCLWNYVNRSRSFESYFANIQLIALRLSVSKLKGKSQARKVRCVIINSGVVASVNFIIFPCKSHALTYLTILVTVFHMMNMRDGYSNSNTHRTFGFWLLLFSLIIGQP